MSEADSRILKRGSSGLCAVYGQKLGLAKTGGKERGDEGRKTEWGENSI